MDQFEDMLCEGKPDEIRSDFQLNLNYFVKESLLRHASIRNFAEIMIDMDTNKVENARLSYECQIW